MRLATWILWQSNFNLLYRKVEPGSVLTAVKPSDPSSLVLELEGRGSYAGAHTLKLVKGEGDDDNGDFSIIYSQLRTKAVLDREAKPTRSIRIQVKDPVV